MLKKKYKLKPLFKHQLIITGVLVFLLVVGFFGGSYAVFMKDKNANEYNQFQVGDISLSYTDLREEGNTLVLNNDYPVSDGIGSTGSSYRFSVENNGTTPEKYYIVVSDDQAVITSDGCGDKLVNKNFIRYKFDNREIGTLSELYDEDLHGYLMFTGYLNPGESDIHEIRLWLSEESDNSVLGAHFHGKVNAILEQDVLRYKENELNGNDPVLTDNLIPVKISNTGVVTKADLSERWYSYNDKEWANAVVVKSNKKEKYEKADPETEIPEDDIESYFVWIPKYDYKIWNIGNYNDTNGTLEDNSNRLIEVRFTTDDTVDKEGECATPLNENKTQALSGYENRGNCEVGKWMTHPAFITMGVKGLWVGKFETGYSGANSTGAANQNVIDSTKIIIKPNVYSWRNINVSNASETSMGYLTKAENSHMMKNTEWGAVTYLQLSKYGSHTRVRINNNSSYVTGYSAINEALVGFTGSKCEDGVTDSMTCNIYDSSNKGEDTSSMVNYMNPLSVAASTTNNYTGIYDMSGGAHEFVMGVLCDSSGSPFSGRNSSKNSGFKGSYGGESDSNTTGEDFPDDKYYDLYNYNNSSSTENYKNRILGDSTGELGPFAKITYGSDSRKISSWFNMGSLFIYISDPWFVRGNTAKYGSESGAAAANITSGDNNTTIGFRIVLAPKSE